jgi:UDP-glucuronate 4-epimerase
MTGPILVTGSAGFIGYHLCKRLLSLGYTVLGVDSLTSYYAVTLKKARLDHLSAYSTFSFFPIDIAENPEACRILFERNRPIHVVHLAAQAGVRASITHPWACMRSNSDGFLAVLEACRAYPVEHLLYASSSSVYGATAQPPFDDRALDVQPVSLYGASKRANELMATTYAGLYKIPSTGLRFFTVYGPWGRPDMAYFKFTQALFEGTLLEVYHQGQMWRDFTYIEDVITCVERLLTCIPPHDSVSGTQSRIVNVGTRTPEAVSTLIALLEQETGRKAQKRQLPFQPGDVLRTCANTERLKALINFEPMTPLATGLHHFVNWYRDFYGVE